MGLICADIQLTNPLSADVRPYFTRALLDAGTLHLCIPLQDSFQLKLRQLEEREVTVADGTKKLVPYVGQ